MTSATGLLPPDWSQLVPDLVSGLFTGIVAGLVLFFVQRVDSRRAERRNADFLWQGIRSSIFMAAAQRSTIDTNDLTAMPEWTESLEATVAGQPLSLWQSLLGYPSIAVLRETIERIQLLRGASGYAEGDLGVAAHRAGLHPATRGTAAGIARQLMRGSSDEQLRGWFGLSGESLDEMKGAAKKILDAVPPGRLEGFEVALQRVARGQEVLLEQLRQEDKPFKPRGLQNFLMGLDL